MFVEVTTTITSKIELGDNGIAGVKHEIDVDGGDFGAALGQRAVLMVVKGACGSALNTVNEMLDNEGKKS